MNHAVIPEAAPAAPTVPEHLLQDMFTERDNAEAFAAVMERGIDTHLDELTLVYYARPAYRNGFGAPETLPESHPLRQKIESLNLEQVENPLERGVFGALRESWHQRAQGGPGDDENSIASLLLPIVIRQHSIGTGRAVMDHGMSHLKYDTTGRSLIAARGVLDEAARKIHEPQTVQERTEDRLRFLLSAAMAASNAEDNGAANVQSYDDFFTNAACEVIVEYMQGNREGIRPETVQNIRNLLSSPVRKLRYKMRQAFSTSAPRMCKIVDAMTNQPRLQRVLNNESPALAEFVTVVNEEKACDPKLLAMAASGLMSEYYAQASKASEETAHHYSMRVKGLAESLAGISANPPVRALFEQYLAETPSASAKMEARAIRAFRALTRLEPENITPFDSIDALESQLIGNLYDRLTGADAPLSDEQRVRLLERFGSTDPLLVYSLKFMSDDAYRDQLAGLVQSVADDNYEAWHRGDGSLEAMRALVDAGHLPQHITPEQYAEWCADSTFSSLEQLVSSSADAAEAIRSSVALGSVDIGLLAPGYSINKEGMDAVVLDRNVLGKLTGLINGQARGQKQGALTTEQVAAVSRGMGAYREIPGVRDLLSRLAAGEDIQFIKQQIEGTRSQLEQLYLLIRIANVSAEEVAAGALLAEPNAEGKRNVQRRLPDVLSYLHKELPPELHFIPESVTGLLASAAAERGEAELMTAEDTIDPKVTLEIGEIPQRTCQHYESGEFNQGLIGYFGPDVKIGIIRNEKGNIVARSIIRLMEDEQGNAVLFAEPVYQSVVSPQVRTLLSEHLNKKAAKMGVKLKGSLSDAPQSGEILRVRVLKMPAAYSDAATTLLPQGRLIIKV
jgi:hypothetical protein